MYIARHFVNDRARKIRHPFYGPFRVKQVTGNSTILVSLTKGKKKIVSQRDMKFFKGHALTKAINPNVDKVFPELEGSDDDIPHDQTNNDTNDAQGTQTNNNNSTNSTSKSPHNNINSNNGAQKHLNHKTDNTTKTSITQTNNNNTTNHMSNKGKVDKGNIIQKPPQSRYNLRPR